MVSGNLVLRVSGRESTSKPDRRHKLMMTMTMMILMTMKMTMMTMMTTMNLPKVRKGMRAGEEGTRRSPSRRT